MEQCARTSWLAFPFRETLQLKELLNPVIAFSREHRRERTRAYMFGRSDGGACPYRAFFKQQNTEKRRGDTVGEAWSIKNSSRSPGCVCLLPPERSFLSAGLIPPPFIFSTEMRCLLKRRFLPDFYTDKRVPGSHRGMRLLVHTLL